jgi:pyruvate formate lyase activating enzyme
LVAETFQKISAWHLDPIEKKPLYHFYPGKKILSVGSVGCNLRCTFCQNCEISQTGIDTFLGLISKTPRQVVAGAQNLDDNIGIAFTYNEPIIFFEYMLEIAERAKEADLKTVMISNGFVNEKPLAQILPFIDAFNIDLKSFRDSFYRKQTGASLSPVLNTLKMIRKAGKHLEITNLIIPTLNDDSVVFQEMVQWISEELGEQTVLHLSRYFPHHQLRIESTPFDTLLKLYGIARSRLHFVYLGNLHLQEGNSTICPVCNELWISRHGYQTSTEGLTRDGQCIKCGHIPQNLLL